jgi:tetratricopeptide (TPR) repeat protein
MRFVHDLALSSAGPATDPVAAGWLEHDRAIPDIEQGHRERGRDHLLHAFELFQAAQDTGALARCCSSLSHVCERLDLLDESIEWAERGLKFATEAGENSVLGINYLALGVLYNRVGRPDDAAAAFRTSLELAVASGNERSRARRLRIVAASYLDCGELARGIEYINAALAVFEDQHDSIGYAESLENLGATQLKLGKLDAAERSARECLRIAADYDDTLRKASTLATLADIKEAQGSPAAADDLRRRSIAIYDSEGMLPAATALRALLNPQT